MKLRNKKTGEIVEPFGITCINGRSFVQFDDGKGIFKFEAHSLAELNEMFEDYEEPKEYWHIDCDGEIEYDRYEETSFDKDCKAIGNYFETREEAEKAVEKLKAWKRLKDNGMIKYSFCKEKTGIDLDFYTLTILAPRDKDSLDLLFGGEECKS